MAPVLLASLLLGLTLGAAVVAQAVDVPAHRPQLLRHPHRAGAARSPPAPSAANCTVHWFRQVVDHFGWETSFAPAAGAAPTAEPRWQQRYFVCDSHFKGKGAPIFFYVGNEADVELYVNATGLMWESAPQYGALLVFAEHRYFGQSMPFGADTRRHMNYLSSEQALADYATLILDLRKQYGNKETAVIGFGGSYGGMLASWLRMKYPSAVDGVIAGSAPIVSFGGEDPAYNVNSFAQVVTYDATKAGGASSDQCASNIRSAWQALFRLGKTAEGRGQLQQAFRMCKPIKDSADVTTLAYWAQSSFDYMAMGSYPFASSYMTNGAVPPLPPYPMRVACSHIDASSYGSDAELLEGLRGAIGVFYNYTHDKPCFEYVLANNATQQDALFWDYLACTEMCQPMGRDGVTDMFWSQPWDAEGYSEGCQSRWGVTPRLEWATITYGGWRIGSISNIVFTNGELDPWSKGGITRNISDSLLAIVIPDVGHHIDLMFSNPADPPAVRAAREMERGRISLWIQQVKEAARATAPQ